MDCRTGNSSNSINEVNTMNWDNLKEMRCPETGSSVFEDTGLGYRWDSGFYISYEKFQEVVNSRYGGRKSRKYDPDSVDRSDWQ